RERVRRTLGERLRQAAGGHRAQRVAVAARVLGRDQALLAGDPHRDRAPLVEQRLGESRIERAGTKVSAQAQHVVQLVRVARRSTELRLYVLQSARVDELPQLVLAEQLLEQVPVERQHLSAAFGRRRVVLVHVRGDVVEEKRARIGRGGRRFHVHQVKLPRLQPVQETLERRQVENVLQTFAVGLEDDRERAVPARDLEQALC